MLICGASSPIKPLCDDRSDRIKAGWSIAIENFFEPNTGKPRTSFLESTAVLIAGQRTG
jgi:hypothetical protein